MAHCVRSRHSISSVAIGGKRTFGETVGFDSPTRLTQLGPKRRRMVHCTLALCGRSKAPLKAGPEVVYFAPLV